MIGASGHRRRSQLGVSAEVSNSVGTPSCAPSRCLLLSRSARCEGCLIVRSGAVVYSTTPVVAGSRTTSRAPGGGRRRPRSCRRGRDDRPGDGQTEPGPVARSGAGVVERRESLEHVVAALRRDAGSVVEDGHDGLAAGLGEGDHTLAVAWRTALSSRLRVTRRRASASPWTCAAKTPATSIGGGPRGGAYLVEHEVVEVDRGRRARGGAAGIVAGEDEEVVDEALQLLDLVEHALRAARLSASGGAGGRLRARCGYGPAACEVRARRRRRSGAGAGRPLETVEHRVHRRRQPGDLVIAGGCGTRWSRSSGPDRVGLAADPLDGAQRATDERKTTAANSAVTSGTATARAAPTGGVASRRCRPAGGDVDDRSRPPAAVTVRHEAVGLVALDRVDGGVASSRAQAR